jgi:hypothetical protein
MTVQAPKLYTCLRTECILTLVISEDTALIMLPVKVRICVFRYLKPAGIAEPDGTTVLFPAETNGISVMVKRNGRLKCPNAHGQSSSRSGRVVTSYPYPGNPSWKLRSTVGT